MRSLKTGALALALAANAGVLAAEPEIGAENYLTEVNGNTVIGGASAQRLAQVFELHGSGEVSHLMLPVACAPGTVLRVTIEDAATGVPSGTVLAVQDVPGQVLDAVQWGNAVAAMRMIEFTRPVKLRPGLYAFTLARRGKGDCALWRAPAGAPYAYYAYLVASGNPPGWQLLLDGAGRPQHLAFQVYQRP